MKWFDYAAPESLPEAIELLSAHPGALPMAGGTDLLVELRSAAKQTELVIDVKRIPELNELSYDPVNGLTLGAAVPCCRIYEDRAVSRAYPALAEVASLIGGIQIQSRASIGGNLCNAAPSADSAPVLIVLQASCRIAGPAGIREVAAEGFCTGPGRNVLRPGELLVSLQLPPPDLGSGARYLRFTPRNEMDIAVAGAAAAVSVEDGRFRSARIALAAVAPKPLLVRKAGAWLPGQPVNAMSIQAAAGMAKAAARPITDMRGTARFRRLLCVVLTRRALEAAVRRAKGRRS
ncbi:MAG: xanthine dehydrogenase family protein subunit M [Acidobacteriota bacterium]